MLSENKEREDKYQTIIDHLSGNVEQGIEDIQERLEQLAAKQNNGSRAFPAREFLYEWMKYEGTPLRILRPSGTIMEMIRHAQSDMQ